MRHDLEWSHRRSFLIRISVRRFPMEGPFPPFGMPDDHILRWIAEAQCEGKA